MQGRHWISESRQVRSHTHTHRHTHTHTHILQYRHTYADVHTYTYCAQTSDRHTCLSPTTTSTSTHTPVCENTRVYMCIHIPQQSKGEGLTYTLSLSLSLAHAHLCTHLRRHTQIQKYTCVYIYRSEGECLRDDAGSARAATMHAAISACCRRTSTAVRCAVEPGST